MIGALLWLAWLQVGAAPTPPRDCEKQPLARSFALNQIPVPGSVAVYYQRDRSPISIPVRGFRVSGAAVTLDATVRLPASGHFCVEYRGVAPVACANAKANLTSASHWSSGGRNCVSVWDRRRGARSSCCVGADGAVEILGPAGSAIPAQGRVR